VKRYGQFKHLNRPVLWRNIDDHGPDLWGYAKESIAKFENNSIAIPTHQKWNNLKMDRIREKNYRRKARRKGER
jgi:hypothetical protein